MTFETEMEILREMNRNGRSSDIPHPCLYPKLEVYANVYCDGSLLLKSGSDIPLK